MTDQFWAAIEAIILFLPRLIGALLVLLIGWILGRVAGSLVQRLVDAVQLDELVLDTPLGGILGGTERAVSNSFGTLARWFVYALAFMAAANVLAIDLLSQWIDRAVSYLPAFVAGLLIIVIGFVVADFVGNAILRTQAATETGYTSWFASGTRLFLYFIVIVMGLDTMGVDVGILFVFARALAWGFAAAIAIGVGVALGWGGKDFVAENVGRWASESREGMPDPDESGSRDRTGGGAPPESDD